MPAKRNVIDDGLSYLLNGRINSLLRSCKTVYFNRKELRPGQTESQVDASFDLAFDFRLVTYLRGVAETFFDRAQIRLQVDARFELAFRLATHLRWLALTMIELKFTRESAQVFHRLARQKLISSQINLRLFATCVNLQADLRIRLAILCKSVLG